MKAYNQKYGYAEGDILIKAVGKLLAKYFGNENCCRVTADHFAIFSDHKDFDQKLA